MMPCPYSTLLKAFILDPDPSEALICDYIMVARPLLLKKEGRNLTNGVSFLFMASKVKNILNSRASDSQLLFEVLIIISQYIDEDMSMRYFPHYMAYSRHEINGCLYKNML